MNPWKFIDWAHVERMVRITAWFIVAILVVTILVGHAGSTNSGNVHAFQGVYTAHPVH